MTCLDDTIILSQTSHCFYMSAGQVYIENTVGKGEIAHDEHFSISHSFFYPFGELSTILIRFKIVVCKLFRNFLFGKGFILNLPSSLILGLYFGIMKYFSTEYNFEGKVFVFFFQLFSWSRVQRSKDSFSKHKFVLKKIRKHLV